MPYRILLCILAIALILLPGPTTTQAQKVKNLWQTIVDAPELTTFAAMLKATGDAALLDKSGPMTVFAPNDDAFNEYFKALGKSKETVLGDTTLVENVVLHHIVPGSITPAGVVSIATDKLKVATAVGPDTVAFSIKDNLAHVEDIKISSTYTKTANGYLFRLGAVMLPKVKFETPTADDIKFLSTEKMKDEPTLQVSYALYMQVPAMSAFIVSHNLTTWFAPTDDAWNKVMQDNKLNYTELAHAKELPRILLTHVVPYYYPTSTLLKLNGAHIATAADNALVLVAVQGDKLSIGRLNVVKGDLLGKDYNVIHVIDGVLFPPKPLAELPVPTAAATQAN